MAASSRLLPPSRMRIVKCGRWMRNPPTRIWSANNATRVFSLVIFSTDNSGSPAVSSNSTSPKTTGDHHKSVDHPVVIFAGYSGSSMGKMRCLSGVFATNTGANTNPRAARRPKNFKARRRKSLRSGESVSGSEGPLAFWGGSTVTGTPLGKNSQNGPTRERFLSEGNGPILSIRITQYPAQVKSAKSKFPGQIARRWAEFSLC